MESLLFSTTNNNSTLHDISLGNVSNALNRSKLLLNEITKPKDDFSLERDKNDKKSSIYAQFKMDTNKNIDEDGDLIELLQSYSKTCAEYSGFLKERLQQLNSNRQKDLYNSTLNELDEIDKEKHLWHLLKLLYVDEQNESEGGVGGRDEESGMITDMSSDVENEEEAVVNEKTIVKRLEKTCPLLRRIRAVIEWLEGIARESDYLRTVRESMSSFSEKCANWEHTFHYLKSSNSINKKDKVFFSGRDFVTELDPDAPIRQNKSLHDLDQEDEYKIMEYIFAFIRAGDLDTARDFCYKIGQSWRAATLEGFKLYQDNNYSRANSRSSRLAAANRKEQEIFKNEGNFNRDIWRLMVYKLIKDEHFGPYEKAVYASLAGFVSPVLPVCKTYMDFIWAYFKGLYNKIIDRELRQRITVRDYINMPFDTDEDHLFLSTGGKGASSDQSNLPTISQIFERIRVLISSCDSAGSTAPLDGLSASSSSSSFSMNLLNGKAQLVNALKADLNRPYSIVLKYVISSGLEGFKSGTNELMDYLKTALIEEKQNGYLLRLSAHLALFYRSASFQIKEDTFIQILDTYSQYLIQHGYKEIIAYYLSHLPAEINIKRYSKFLQMIEDNKERLVLIKLAKERNMNVQAITLNIVDTLSKHSITSLNKRESLEQEQTMGNRTSVANDMLFLATSSKQSQTLTDEDRTKINAIDWILYDPAQRLKLLEYANLTMRYFLLERKNFEATRLVFAKIPSDSIAIILGQYNYYGGGNNSSLNTSTASSTAEANFNVAMENLPQKVSNYIKEYLCFKEYIESIKLYNEWFEFFHKEKPQKPAVSSSSSTTIANNNSQTFDQSSSQDRTFAERMTQEFHLKQYDDLMSRWHSKAVAYSERARVKFLSVLKFPHGGWMCDPNRTNSGAQDEMSDDDDEEDEEKTDKQSDDENMMEDEGVDAKTCPNSKRQLQLQALRKLYLPNIAFVLVDMLAKMNLNKELIKIADLVAARHYKLFELFEPEQMRCFLNKIADSSINLIDSNSDYLGYN